jgi:hypothetical protein
VDADPTELRLFFEGLACDLLFFEHAAAGVPPEARAVDRYARRIRGTAPVDLKNVGRLRAWRLRAR